MPGFWDSGFIILLALLLFGPKKLPVLARQLGKLMADFRRASNEFRTQMEEELRISEQAERQKQLAAAAASAVTGSAAMATDTATTTVAEPEPLPPPPELQYSPVEPKGAEAAGATAASDAPVAPIATSGELSILPPATGLPVENTGYTAEQIGAEQNGVGPNGAGAHHEAAGTHEEAAATEHEGLLETETRETETLHG
jgi:sec-independent protein translocase protein TatB